IAAMSARSRNPDTESFGIESSSVLASSRLQTGVLPFLTTYFGPRTECAGFDGGNYLACLLPPGFHFSREILFSLLSAGTRPRAGGVSDRSAADRANTAAENLRGSGLHRSRLAPDGPAGATGRDHRPAPRR